MLTASKSTEISIFYVRRVTFFGCFSVAQREPAPGHQYSQLRRPAGGFRVKKRAQFERPKPARGLENRQLWGKTSPDQAPLPWQRGTVIKPVQPVINPRCHGGNGGTVAGCLCSGALRVPRHGVNPHDQARATGAWGQCNAVIKPRCHHGNGAKRGTVIKPVQRVPGGTVAGGLCSGALRVPRHGVNPHDQARATGAWGHRGRGLVFGFYTGA